MSKSIAILYRPTTLSWGSQACRMLPFQEAGYMMRRGLSTGLITCYDATWLLKTDRKGVWWCSPPIRLNQCSTPENLSATEASLPQYFGAMSLCEAQALSQGISVKQ